MGNKQQYSNDASDLFSFQPLLSYKLAKTNPTILVPAKQLKEQLPWLDWSLINIKFLPQSHEWDFLSEDWSLKRRWRLLVLAHKDHFQQNIYDYKLLNPLKSVFKQIDKDVTRTYPNTKFFQDQYNVQVFSRILKNIALYFPEAGYTQGINFVIGFLLQCGFRQQQTFWMFVHLSLDPDVFMIGYYEDEFPLANLSHDLFMLLMKQHYPDLAQKVTTLALPKQIWVFQWFLTFFLNSFPVDMCKMLWDYILVGGAFGIVYLSLGIIDQTYNHLISLRQDSDFGIYFQSLRDRQTLSKSIDFNKLFAKAKQLQLGPSTLAVAISKISEAKAYRNIYSEFYSNYDNPQKIKSLYANFLRQMKKQRLLGLVNFGKSSMMKSSKIMNPIQFCMIESTVKTQKSNNIASLILLKHIRQTESKRTQILEGSNFNEESQGSQYGYYFRYPKNQSNRLQSDQKKSHFKS